MSMTEKIKMPRKVCPLIMIADTSDSMAGAPIGAENAAMEGTLKELISMNDDNPDAVIKIGILDFNTGCEWLTGGEGLVDPKDYEWADLTADGVTSLGEAFSELNDKLSVSHGFMKEATSSMSPVIILISDGAPTDNYIEPLNKLKENNWYKVAAKIAIGYGASNDEMLKEFTGNEETVIHTNDPKELKMIFKFAAITSSMVVSTGRQEAYEDSSNNDPEDATNAIANALKENRSFLSDEVDPHENW